MLPRFLTSFSLEATRERYENTASGVVPFDWKYHSFDAEFGAINIFKVKLTELGWMFNDLSVFDIITFY